MKLLDLLGTENSDAKKAIQYLLDSHIEEAEWYQKKQSFTLDHSKTGYRTQQEHAIDWLFSKALWNKSKVKGDTGINVKTLVRNIQCAPLIVYVAIATNVLTEEEARELEETIIRKLKNSKEINAKNVRFAEKKMVTNKIGNTDWAERIVKSLLSPRK